MEALLLFLLWLCVYALIIVVICWIIVKVVFLVLSMFNLTPPAQTATLIYVIGGLILLIWAVQHIPALKLP